MSQGKVEEPRQDSELPADRCFFRTGPSEAESCCRTLRLEALGRFSGGIVHDFNNLLTIVQSHLTLLRQANEDTSRMEILNGMEIALQQATQLNRQLLGFVRQEVRSLQPTDLNAVVVDVTGLVRRTADARVCLETRCSPGTLPILAEPSPLTQVVLNLCLNACDAMPEGGRLVVETEKLFRPRREALASMKEYFPEGNRRHDLDGFQACLRISDTGEGIPPERLAQIFEPFFTTRSGRHRAGMGLAIVHAVVQQLGGWIECRSAPSVGTCFEVFLPLTTAVPVAAVPAAPPVPPADMPQPEVRGVNVLVVDNESAVVRLVRAVLEQNGYGVLTANNGNEAVEVFRRERNRIHVVLLDENMPGLCGSETMEEMRQLDPGVRVVLSSGFDVADSAPGREPGRHGSRPAPFPTAFLPKPYSPVQLLKVVAEAVGNRG